MRLIDRAPVVVVAALLSCGAAMAGAPIAKVDVTQYKHWPVYAPVRVEKITPQTWRNSDDVIAGWDWSLPPDVKPSPSALLCVTRSSRHLPKLNFPANPTVSLWVFWSDLEPEEDVYRFDTLKEQLAKIKAAGYSAVIRPMTAVWQRPSYPDASKTPAGRKKPCAARYLVTKYDVPRIEEKPKGSWRIVNLDVAHPDFHRRYVKFVRELGKSGIPRLDVVKGFIVGYKSSSWGDEGIGPWRRGGEPEAKHVRERLDAWARACKGVEAKVCMGAVSEYGLAKGFGVRHGFVEMYLYHIPDPHLGQTVEKDGYLVVDEQAPIIARRSFSGDENEEYEKGWVHRFGQLESFTYRYFVSSLRVLQMRRNYLLHNPFGTIPEMLPFTALEMGRTVDDAPDVWCALRESYLRGRGEQARTGVPVKNFERWLFQRDKPGYETKPAVKIDHAIRMWSVHGNKKTGEGKFFDYAARRGRKIGFHIDGRFLRRAPHVAVKITYIDEKRGTLAVNCRGRKGSVALKGDGAVRTATFFFRDAESRNPRVDGYDLVVEGRPEAVVAFVRVVRVR